MNTVTAVWSKRSEALCLILEATERYCALASVITVSMHVVPLWHLDISITFNWLLIRLLAGLVVLFLCYAVYQIFFSALRHLPGPWWASVTNLFLVLHSRSATSHWDIIELHRKYGDTIRIGPNDV